MNVIILEDEPLAREKLRAGVRSIVPQALILAEFGSVRESAAWLRCNAPPDLLFADIQLSDGLSFEVFSRTHLECPVIFTTAYDEYFLEAFQANGIDYLLKPIRKEKLEAAICKYKLLRRHFTAGLAERIMPPRATRVLVRKGIGFASVKAEDIAYAYTSEKLVFIVLRDGSRSVIEKSIADLEAALDAKHFCRATRSALLSIDAVTRCVPAGKGRLTVEVSPPFPGEISVSQERAAAFRKWLGG